MHQISNYVYADDALLGMDIPTKRLPNPYQDFPYLVFEGVLSPELCKAITATTYNKTTTQQATLRGGDLNTSIRNTLISTLSVEHQAYYDAMMEQYRSEIESFFSMVLKGASPVQVLAYEPGDFYAQHADDSSQLVSKEQECIGYKVVAPERKITTVLFTTSYTPHPTDKEHFSGGELLFNYLSDIHGNTIRLRPEAGDMVVFLSNPYFSHEVLPVKEGYRVSLAQWHDALG